MKITEPTTMITDYILAILTAWWGVMLWRTGRQQGQTAVTLWGASFLAVTVASIAGGTAHGFAFYLEGLPKVIFWKTTLYAIGAASFCVLAGTLFATVARPIRSWLLGVAVLGLVAYAAWMINHDDFKYVIYYYAPSMVVVLILQIYAAYALKADGAPWIIAGVIVAFAAAGIQRSGFSLHRHFNHNDIYHVVQMASFYLLYRGASLLTDL
jgi:hypothetical protein